MKYKNLIILLGLLFAVSTPLHDISHDYSETAITYECHACSNEFSASTSNRLIEVESFDSFFIEGSIFPRKFTVVKSFHSRAPPLI